MSKNSEHYSKMLDAQVAAVTTAVGEGKSGRWPMPTIKDTFTVTVYCDPLIARAMYDAFEKLDPETNGYDSIREAYKYPSRLGRAPFIFPNRALWDLEQEEKEKLGEYIAKTMTEMYDSHSFVEEGKNILLPQKEAETLVTSADYLPTVTKTASRLPGILWILTETLFPRWHNTYHEYHGPYEVGGKIYMIKDFHDLHPPHYPKEHLSHSFESVQVIEEYERGAEFHLDLQNRMIAGDNNRNLLSRMAFKKDGKFLNESEVEELKEEVQESLKKMVPFIQNMSIEEIIVFNGVSEFFTLAYPLCKLAGCETELPKEFFERVKSFELTEREREVADWIASQFKDVNNFPKLFDVKHNSST